jgi:outer membrane biogenesis lipoprotein LolB
MEAFKTRNTLKRSREDLGEIISSTRRRMTLEQDEGLELLLSLSVAAQMHSNGEGSIMEVNANVTLGEDSPDGRHQPNEPAEPNRDKTQDQLYNNETDSNESLSSEEDDEEALLMLQGRSNSELDDDWQTNFDKLRKYKEEHGHIDVSPKEDRSLTAWLRHQRKESSKQKLSDEQIDSMSDMGFIWNSRGNRNSWEDKFNKLKEFKEKNGHCKVPLKLDRQLNSWVDAQRQANKQGRLSEERIRKLEGLGVQWIVKSWESKFRKLHEFKDTYGHCNVPLHTEKQLYRWVVDQRRAHKRGKLSSERAKRLEELGIRLTSKKDMKFKNLENSNSTSH